MRQQQLSGTTEKLFKIKDLRPLWQRLKEAGIPIEAHETDLYFPETPESMQILKEYREENKSIFNVYRFIDSIDKKPWIEIPFGYSEIK